MRDALGTPVTSVCRPDPQWAGMAYINDVPLQVTPRFLSIRSTHIYPNSVHHNNEPSTAGWGEILGGWYHGIVSVMSVEVRMRNKRTVRFAELLLRIFSKDALGPKPPRPVLVQPHNIAPPHLPSRPR